MKYLYFNEFSLLHFLFLLAKDMNLPRRKSIAVALKNRIKDARRKSIISEKFLRHSLFRSGHNDEHSDTDNEQDTILFGKCWYIIYLSIMSTSTSKS